ncbi:MAG: HIT domain-containing protein [Methylibium sp.]|nr:HIT domain-containing protein [Methylibium sp.]
MPEITPSPTCPLCQEAGGLPVFESALWRVVRVVDAPEFPAFYRLIWQAHVAEFSDLPAAQRQQCMEAVTAIEQVLREALAPTKINLATLGNVVPHLHWHVIARFDWDSHFPQPIWGERQRSPQPPASERLALPLPALDARVSAALRAL